MIRYIELGEHKKEIAAKDKRIAELEAKLDLSMCAYCGFTVKKSEAKDDPFPLADHILACEKSPLVKLNKKQEEQIAELEAQVEKMREVVVLVRESGCNCSHAPCSDTCLARLAEEALKEAK